MLNNEFIQKTQEILNRLTKHLQTDKKQTTDYYNFLVENQLYLYEDLKTYDDHYGNVDSHEYNLQENQILAALYYDIHQLIPLIYTKDSHAINLLNLTKAYFDGLVGQDSIKVDDYRKYKLASLEDELNLKFKLECDHTLNNQILKDYKKPDSMYEYGLALSGIDQKLSEFLESSSKKDLDLIADTIVNAFLHGFISQNRNRRDRTGVRFQYTIGQEAIASRVVDKFKQIGIRANVIKVIPHQKFTQFTYDHLYDIGLILDETYSQIYLDSYKRISQIYKEQLKNVCGYVGIGSFGAVESAPVSKASTLKLSKDQEKLYNHLKLQVRLIDDSYIRPSDISFCRITFPNPSIKGNFHDIFNDFIQINTMKSDEYEKYQQVIIDALDKGDYVHCVGYKGNQTDIMVRLGTLSDSTKETNFMNCGGDLNIPHGEVFTTPILKGSSGLLHFKQIFLKGYKYKDLKLEFKDGMVVNYSCANFNSLKENKKYIEDTLFDGKKNIPMGEFAIGTNTLAYKTLKKHRIIEELPILLVEKMGPHFAIGDPCYAFGEEESVFNLLDGKEIIAKENERTQLRHSHIEEAYTGLHVDMTIPYEEIYDLNIISQNHKQSLIRHGLFSLEGLDLLNEPLIEEDYDFAGFSLQIQDYLSCLFKQKNRIKKSDYFKNTIEKLQKDNEGIYGMFLRPYETSLLNPSYVYKHYGYDGLVLSAILHDSKDMILLMYRNREITFNKYVAFLHKVIDCINENRIGEIYNLYNTFKLAVLEEMRYGEFTSSFLDRVFNQTYNEEGYLFRYGFYVKKEDYLTSQAFKSLGINLLDESGKVIAEAFHKGFKISGKDRGSRKIAKLEYHLGQEPLMTYVASHLKMLGFHTKVTAVYPSELNMKLSIDHTEDQALYLNETYLIEKKQKIKELASNASIVLKDICGFVRLLQFGKLEESSSIASEKLSLSDNQKELLKEMMQFERNLSQMYMPKKEMSYTGAAYPSYNIDPRFDEILLDIIKINRMSPDLYEKIQDIIIEALNQADYVEVKGSHNNQTNIRVNIVDNFDRAHQTAFKNTGADVNIPVGEVFTTPVLQNTNGLLHVSEAYRDSYRYDGLMLEFKDGMVVDYKCSNYESLVENKKYLEATLLQPHRTLPMGEFAIGTNTYAYSIAKKYGIIDKLPGLIVEKMGPHFAIGDTCFAYGEDVTVKNHTSGKEMIAKDNEITLKRHQGDQVYYNTHTDITIPYEELAYVDVVRKDKTRISIIKDGKFVLEGSQMLNKYL